MTTEPEAAHWNGVTFTAPAAWVPDAEKLAPAKSFSQFRDLLFEDARLCGKSEETRQVHVVDMASLFQVERGAECGPLDLEAQWQDVVDSAAGPFGGGIVRRILAGLGALSRRASYNRGVDIARGPSHWSGEPKTEDWAVVWAADSSGGTWSDRGVWGGGVQDMHTTGGGDVSPGGIWRSSATYPRSWLATTASNGDMWVFVDVAGPTYAEDGEPDCPASHWLRKQLWSRVVKPEITTRALIGAEVYNAEAWEIDE